MINWILGGLIIAATAYIIVRQVLRMKRGQGTCCSSGDCSKGGCSGCGSK